MMMSVFRGVSAAGIRATASRSLSSNSPNFAMALKKIEARITEGTPVEGLRNVAIVAHVDHGKTTLVDELLKQSVTNDATKKAMDQEDRILDSDDLEKERGITILSSATAVEWKGTRVNIVDTPGHGDFGGQVEQVLSMVDGVVLLVDAREGVMAQTKFVLRKAFGAGLKPLVVVNKADREDRNIDAVLTEIEDLFLTLATTDDQLDYSVLYASGRDGWAVKDMSEGRDEGLKPLLDLLVDEIPAPKAKDGDFSMLVTQLEHDRHLGRMITGRVASGSVKVGDRLKVLVPATDASKADSSLEEAKVTKVLRREGVERVSVDVGESGDIISLSGFKSARVSHSIAHLEAEEALTPVAIDPPVLSMVMGVNDSPLNGKEGSKLTSTVIKERLERETESNLSLETHPCEYSAESTEVRGRGELQLGILLENMRREGYELSVSPPKVLMKEDEDGNKVEPYEEVTAYIPPAALGTVIETLSMRKGNITNVEHADENNDSTEDAFAVVTCEIPSRGLLGFRSSFVNITRGEGLLSSIFAGYEPYAGPIEETKKGAIISNAQGTTTAYALNALEPRGTLFIGAGVDVYEGMVVGEYTRSGDLDVNPVKGKKLTNVRASGTDEAVRLNPPRVLTLEESITYMRPDMQMEVTPSKVRLRMKTLSAGERSRLSRGRANGKKSKK